MARPSEYNIELCREICELIADGGSVRSVLASNNLYPDFTTWCRWKREHEELRNLYINAQQDKTEALIDNIQRVRDMALNGEIEPSVANVVMQTDKWLSAKFYPKMFGEKVDVTSDNKAIQTNINILSIDPLNDDATDNGTS
jgi:hypothetical protein